MTQHAATSCFDQADRLRAFVLDPLKRQFVGKDEIVDLLGIALVAAEHLFILGPPGTAKSAIVHRLGDLLHGETFAYLLTRFTEPNEIFGPFDIRRLREGVLVPNTEGMLPEACLAFLDELFHANSAVLNSLLSALNERVLRRGRELRRLPLITAVGASNQLPGEEALCALFDRFLLRVRSEQASEDQLDDVLKAGWALEDAGPQPESPISTDDVRLINARIPDVDLNPVRPAYASLIRRIRRTGIAFSDRRAVKMQRVLAASALLCRRLTATLSDLWVLRHCWDREDQIEILAALVDETLAQAPSDPVNDHPGSHDAATASPELLAAHLDELRRHFETLPAHGAGASALRDRLALLASRSQWIDNHEQRDALQNRIDALWKDLETHPA